MAEFFSPRYCEFGCLSPDKNKDNGLSSSRNSCQNSVFKILENCVIKYGTDFFTIKMQEFVKCEIFARFHLSKADYSSIICHPVVQAKLKINNKTENG